MLQIEPHILSVEVQDLTSQATIYLLESQEVQLGRGAGNALRLGGWAKQQAAGLIAQGPHLSSLSQGCQACACMAQASITHHGAEAVLRNATICQALLPGHVNTSGQTWHVSRQNLPIYARDRASLLPAVPKDKTWPSRRTSHALWCSWETQTHQSRPPAGRRWALTRAS